MASASNSRTKRSFGQASSKSAEVHTSGHGTEAAAEAPPNIVRTVCAMASSVAVPTEVMSSLLAGFAAGSAARTLKSIKTRKTRPKILHPGDSFGRVFAWVWKHDRNRAMILLADYLAELRVHGPGFRTCMKVGLSARLLDHATG